MLLACNTEIYHLQLNFELINTILKAAAGAAINHWTTDVGSRVLSTYQKIIVHQERFRSGCLNYSNIKQSMNYVYKPKCMEPLATLYDMVLTVYGELFVGSTVLLHALIL